MPTYNFRIDDGTAEHPDVRCDLAGDAAAHDHAAAIADALIREEPARFRRGAAWRMLVTDERGILCLSLDFVGAAAPAHGAHSYGAFATQGWWPRKPAR